MSLPAILDHIVGEKHKEFGESGDISSSFELFVSDLILSNYDVDWSSVEKGIVDGHADGQIDSIYTLVDENIIDDYDEFDASNIRRNVKIDVIIIQAKFKNSFEENVLTKIRSSVADLFDIEKPIDYLKASYNENVIDRINIFRRIYLAAQTKNPSVKFSIVYATKGSHKDAVGRILSDKKAIEDYLGSQFHNATAQCSFLDARELIDLANRPPFETKSLRFSEQPAIDAAGDGWVGLVRIKEFVDFLKDDKGSLQASIFDANVRDFDQSSDVNDEIGDTLSNTVSGIEFWWLNNGVTVLCDDARPHATKTLDVDRPLIVNGLQTSNVVWNHFQLNSPDSEKRHILVRILKSNDESVRDLIIRATNSQTPINRIQLRATDQHQRDIESFFKKMNKYYERRKNMYKNKGVKKSDIITISELGQSLIAIKLGQPNDARARPGLILKKDDNYNAIFDKSSNFEIYIFSVNITRNCKNLLMSKESEKKDVNNLLFYVSYTYSRLLSQSLAFKAEVARQNAEIFKSAMFEEAYAICRECYTARGGDAQAAKGAELIVMIKQRLQSLFSKIDSK